MVAEHAAAEGGISAVDAATLALNHVHPEKKAEKKAGPMPTGESGAHTLFFLVVVCIGVMVGLLGGVRV